MIIRFTSEDNADVVDLHLEPIDNPAVHSWIEYVLSKKKESMSTTLWRITDNGGSCSVNHCIEKCTQAIEELDKLNLHCPYPVPTENHINQKWCNQAHRWFTHQSKQMNQSRRDTSTETKWLQQLNYYIHKMEDNWLPHVIGLEADFEIVAYDNNPSHTGVGHWDFPLNEEIRKDFHSADHYHVILSSEILGKSTLKSFIDGDDPVDWDTSGHYTNFGGINICVTDHRQNLYQSEDFQQWLDRNNATSEDVYYDFPIGNIVNIDDAQDLLRRMDREEFTLTYHRE